MTQSEPRASEQGHWYTRRGVPVYEVERADGKGKRPTTLADARKLDLLPSITTVLRVVDQAGLDLWKQRQLVLSALTIPHEPGEPLELLAERIIEDMAAEGKAAAELGTRIHAAIATALLNDWKQEDQEVDKYVQQVKEWFGTRDISRILAVEQSYANGEYAGKLDAIFELTSGALVVDFKTRKTEPKHKIPTYFHDRLQLGGEALLWTRHFTADDSLRFEPNPEISNVILSTTEERTEEIAYDVDRAVELFRYALGLWFGEKGFWD